MPFLPLPEPVVPIVPDFPVLLVVRVLVVVRVLGLVVLGLYFVVEVVVLTSIVFHPVAVVCGACQVRSDNPLPRHVDFESVHSSQTKTMEQRTNLSFLPETKTKKNYIDRHHPQVP
jgi:hypothetical protein